MSRFIQNVKERFATAKNITTEWWSWMVEIATDDDIPLLLIPLGWVAFTLIGMFAGILYWHDERVFKKRIKRIIETKNDKNTWMS